jgi:hypothetical protein
VFRADYPWDSASRIMDHGPGTLARVLTAGLVRSLEGAPDLEYSVDSVSFMINVKWPASQGNYTHPDDLRTKSRSVWINLRKNRFRKPGSGMVKLLPSAGAFDEETLRRPVAT